MNSRSDETGVRAQLNACGAGLGSLGAVVGKAILPSALLDVATFAQILREECGALEIPLTDGQEITLASRLLRRLEQER